MPEREELAGAERPTQGAATEDAVVVEAAEDLEIARFQAILLEILHLGLPPDQTRARLLAHPDVAPFAAWVSDFDPRAVEVASVITRKFGVRRGPE